MMNFKYYLKLFYFKAAVNWNPKKLNKDVMRNRKSIANKEELQKYNSKEIRIEKELFYNTVHKNSNFTKPKSSVFSYDPLNTIHIPTSCEDNIKTSPIKTTVTSNFILTTNYSDNNNPNRDDEILSTSPTNKQISTDKTKIDIEPDILSSIKTLGNIIGQNSNKNLKNEDITKLTELNTKIQNLETKQDINDENEYKNSRLNSYINDSKNLLVENNIIRRDTFIDNNFNKKYRLYEKDLMIDEINKNSDMRLKKYEILLDFIGNNIRELSDLVNAQASIDKNVNTILPGKLMRNPETKVQRLRGKALSIDNKANPIQITPRKILTDFDKSILESSNDEEFFQDLLGHNFANFGNFSNEMSSLRSKVDISIFGNKFDQTQNQYDDLLYNYNKNVEVPSYSEDTYNVPEEMEGSRIKKNTPSFM